jgi:riboflavin kinase/FMN adenylyltransferase
MLSGIVITGKQLGRTIGFPTANIFLDPWHIEDGTYGLIVEVWGKQHFGIGVYLERFSTFESHILDFEWDIYGQEIRINPVVKIRDN